MSKVQTRRSISVSGAAFDRVKAAADTRGVGCSAIVEEACADLPTVEESRAKLEARKTAEEIEVSTKAAYRLLRTSVGEWGVGPTVGGEAVPDLANEFALGFTDWFDTEEEARAAFAEEVASC